MLLARTAAPMERCGSAFAPSLPQPRGGKAMENSPTHFAPVENVRFAACGRINRENHIEKENSLYCRYPCYCGEHESLICLKNIFIDEEH